MTPLQAVDFARVVHRRRPCCLRGTADGVPPAALVREGDEGSGTVSVADLFPPIGEIPGPDASSGFWR